MKKYQKIVPVIASAILLFTPSIIYAEESITGETTPNPSPVETEEPKEETKITLDKTELTLGVGEDDILNATVTPSTSAKIEWKSSREEVALVKEDGTIRAQSIGTTTITATVNGASATCTVTVVEKHVTPDPSPSPSPTPEEKPLELTLKSLNIKNGTLDKTFQPDVYEYTVTIPSDVTALSMEYDTTEGKDKVGALISGNSKLKNGSEIKIIVSETNPKDKDNPKTQTYLLKIQKETVNLDLKSLEINGYALNETFSKDKTSYTANIPYEIQTISIKAEADDNENKVTVTGLTNLKVGENLVTVTVKDDSGNTKVYQITVTREKEQSIEENPTSIITSSTITSNDNSTSSSGIVGSLGNSSDDGFLKYLIVSIACLILLAIGGIGIYFYWKTSPKKLRKELEEEKEEAEASPIVEVNEKSEDKTTIEDKSEVEDLIDTKEFKINHNSTTNNPEKKEELENLFDEEDV